MSFNTKNNVKTKSKLPTYTMMQVSKHNKETDAWLVYNNKVYDVTKYIHKHPGALSILKGLGKDASVLFDKIGHSSRAKSIMKKYHIGNLKVNSH